MNRSILMGLLFALCVSACNKEEKPDPAPVALEEKKVEKKADAPKKKKKAASSGLSRATPKTKLEIPTVAELEEEAAKDIKPEHLEAELDRLEAEIVGVPN